MGNQISDLFYAVKCYTFYPMFTYIGGGPQGGLQNIDGYLYYPEFICSKDRIAKARAHDWSEGDFVASTFPKSGTHFMMLTALLIGFKGELPPKVDIHKLAYAPEFNPDNNCRPLDDPPENYPTNPRVCITHMPFHHLKINSETACFCSVFRDPVASLASLRRMEYLLFGPIMSPTLRYFLDFNLYKRPSGWLDHVLGWWSARDKSNVLILTYEDMVQEPEQAVKRLASYMKVTLTQDEVHKVVTCMDKKWAIEHVDPYLYSPKTPFTPPDRDAASKSAFIVDTNSITEKFTKEEEHEIRLEYTRKIKAIMEQKEDLAAAANAASFFQAHPSYFCS